MCLRKAVLKLRSATNGSLIPRVCTTTVFLEIQVRTRLHRPSKTFRHGFGHQKPQRKAWRDPGTRLHTGLPKLFITTSDIKNHNEKPREAQVRGYTQASPGFLLGHRTFKVTTKSLERSRYVYEATHRPPQAFCCGFGHPKLQ